MDSVDLRHSLKQDRISLGITALNGVMGHSLKNQNSPLAVTMGFYHQNRPLALTRNQFPLTDDTLSDRLVVCVHGLASNEQMWAFPAEKQHEKLTSYGSLLMAGHRYTPLYLRYNSGLRISHNGRLLAALLEELLEVYPVPVRELVLIGHSMGGLLIRSACHYGLEAENRWPALLNKVFYLGTPHHGVPWEALAAGLFRRLAISDNALARKAYSLYENRSPSVRDIVNMSLIDEHWQPEVSHPPLPWFEGADHYFIAGSINEDPNHLLSHAFGDVLVPIGSAQARSAMHGHLPTPPNIQAHSAIVPGVKHIALAHHHRVYGQIQQWLGNGAGHSPGLLAQN